MRFLLRFRHRGAGDHLPIWNFGPIGRTNLYFNTTGNACDWTIPPPVIDPISDDRRGRFEPSYCRSRKEQNFGPISRGSDISGLPQTAHRARSDFVARGWQRRLIWRTASAAASSDNAEPRQAHERYHRDGGQAEIKGDGRLRNVPQERLKGGHD